MFNVYLITLLSVPSPFNGHAQSARGVFPRSEAEVQVRMRIKRATRCATSESCTIIEMKELVECEHQIGYWQKVAKERSLFHWQSWHSLAEACHPPPNYPERPDFWLRSLRKDLLHLMLSKGACRAATLRMCIEAYHVIYMYSCLTGLVFYHGTMYQTATN